MEGRWAGGKIWIVSDELHVSAIFFDTEHQQGVVDCELGETEDVHDRRVAFFNAVGKQAGFGRDAFLRERKEHSPMAFVDVGLPGAAEIGFQEVFVRGTEFAQAAEAGKNDSIAVAAWDIDVAIHDGANLFGIFRIGTRRLR